MKNITVLGAGSWGTALALHLAKNGHAVSLWAQRATLVEAIQTEKQNTQYLPGFNFPENLQISADLATVIQLADLILLAVPSHAFNDVLLEIQPFVEDRPIIWAIKGFAKGGEHFLSEQFEIIYGNHHPYAILAGPSFAQEVAAGKPTAVVIASKAKFEVNHFAQPFNSKYFACYTSDDVISVQIGGAVKNVLAIACGIADGMGYGSNSRAALITRGLREMTRLAEALGGRSQTIAGLSGLGDLILTATDNLSRNRRFGLGIGQGKSIQSLKPEIGQIIEGEAAATDTLYLAQSYQVRMPISNCVSQILKGEMTCEAAIKRLLDRQLRPENT